jgi:hypothetical protein
LLLKLYFKNVWSKFYEFVYEWLKRQSTAITALYEPWPFGGTCPLFLNIWHPKMLSGHSPATLPKAKSPR